MGFRFRFCGMSESKEKRWFVEAIHQKISWSRYEIKQKDDIFRYAPPLSPSATSPYNRETTPSSPSSSSSGTRISPSVLFIIVILAVLFFISGLLHLLVRFLVKRPSSSGESQSNRYPEISGSDALQRQLQQLFHLHDSGLDQAFIDALPVFQYREIMGLKEPFDCAVCLCEFSKKDKLRLLPMCSHAFHINCIDTWLLSNSTCPLCRGTLFTSGFPMESPMLDLYDFREDEGFPGNGETGMNSNPKTVEIEEIVAEKGVLPVRLGKFRKLNDGKGEAGGETSSSNLDARRCFSMGSFQYVVGNSELRVAFSNDRRVQDVKLPRDTEQNGDLSTGGDLEGKRISSMAKGESFSASKIWLWSKKAKFSTASDANNSIHSSLNVDLPWMARAQDK